eukprot:GFUD01002097.1.p1 GENE.GFUD01002097.1~~GFUD01002097.1.p1  ORF type:complete len:364 (+),score=117.22 GFUD01002097.1:214-1305(+)
MLGPNVTSANETNEAIYTDPSEILQSLGTNSSLLVPLVTINSMVTNLSLFHPLDFTQLLYQPECPGWVPLNHIYYQVANLFLLLSSLAPNCPGGLLFLRTCLVVSFSLSTVWGWTVACALDTTAWNCLLTVLHCAWCVQTVWRGRTVRLTQEMETVYTALFRPLKVSRRQFQTILSGRKEIRKLSPKEMIIEEKISRVDSLSLVLKGRLVVSQAGRALHLVTPAQFLDSPEWFGVTTDEYFQVSVTALEECSILVWHRDKIKFDIMADPFLQAVFDHVIGRDVVRKLMQVHNISEELKVDKKSASENIDNQSIEEDKEDWDDKKPMIAKETSKETSLMATIIGGDLHNWRLVNIKETEDETIV